jgi:hypothetical protein
MHRQETRRSQGRSHLKTGWHAVALTAVIPFLVIFSAGAYLWYVMLPPPPRDIHGATDDVFFAGWNLVPGSAHELSGVAVSAMSSASFWSTLIAQNPHRPLPPVKVIPQTLRGVDCTRIKAAFVFATANGVIRTTETWPFTRPGLRAFESYATCTVSTEGFSFDIRADHAGFRQHLAKSAAMILVICTMLYVIVLSIALTILADLRRFARRVEERRLRDLLKNAPVPAGGGIPYGYDAAPQMQRARAL